MESVPASQRPLVSVVITTRNEESNIERCLQSVKAQIYPQEKIQIIVVDNASSDCTKELAYQYTEHVFNKGPERSAQRNHGMIEKAQGDYVIYFDADMILSPELIASCVDFVRRTGDIALHVREIVLGTAFWSRVRRFERSFYDGTAIDGARFFQREAFVRVGGFDEDLFIEGSGEDWDIDKKIRQIGRIGLLPAGRGTSVASWPLADYIRSGSVEPTRYSNVIYHNEARFNLGTYLRKKLYYTKGFAGYIQKWGRNDPDIRKQFGFTYRYLTVFTEKGKWKKLVLHPVLTSGMYFLRFLVGICYLSSRLPRPLRSADLKEKRNEL